MVTISTPMPIPDTNRQASIAMAVDWQAIISVAAVYQSRDQVKIARRPKRSASCEKMMVPTKRPANVAAAKVA